MLEVLNPILQWINIHPHFAGAATFFLSALESIAIIGTIIPGTVIMTAIGTLAGAGVIPLWSTILWAILGAIAGDGVSYWLGHHYKERLNYIWPFRTYPSLLENGKIFFDKYGSMSVFIGRFVGPVRALVPLVAGMFGMSPLRFTISNVASAIGWAPAYMLPGILLGAASLELPPDIAVHAILMLLLVTLFVLFCLWFIQKIFKLIGGQINHFLTGIWNRLAKSRYFHLITQVLKHHDTRRTHGQLTLAFYFFATLAILICFALYIFSHGPQSIEINNIMHFLFRSFRTEHGDNIMLAITMLGETRVLAPLIITLFCYFGWQRQWYTAWHMLSIGIFTTAGVEALKHFTKSPRPWGILQSPTGYSFPSGHTTLAVVFFMSIALLLTRSWRLRRSSKRFVFTLAVLMIILISCSRLYLGAHWFTDIIGGWLLGAAILMLICLSYNRKKEDATRPTGILLTVLLTLLVSYSVLATRQFNTLKHNTTQLDSPVYTISQNAWWNQIGGHLPLYRINRFGLAQQILNLQWLGDINNIKQILLNDGWENPPESTWISVLYRMSDVQSAEHLPLVSPLYLNKKPALVLIKHYNNKKLVVLRLWDANLIIKNGTQSLWVGSVELVPRTYSWIFSRKKNQITLDSTILFNRIPALLEIKKIRVHLSPSYHPAIQSMILIKSKNNPA